MCTGFRHVALIMASHIDKVMGSGKIIIKVKRACARQVYFDTLAFSIISIRPPTSKILPGCDLAYAISKRGPLREVSVEGV